MAGREPTPFERLAEPVLAWGETLAHERGRDTGALLRQTGALLDRFGADLIAAGAIASAVPPARYALALILDQKARSNRRIDVRTWAAGAQRYLFDGRDISTANLRDFIRKAEAAGPEFAGVGHFLESCL
ncbi:MAG: IcmF-related protein, partial [Paracoccaceae bacterium]|nr:IcmF-related protein [Paracoccaceae bacterium]